MQDDVCAWLGARGEGTQPCVERQGARQTEGCARLRDEDGEGSNGRDGAIVDEGGGGYLCVIACWADEGQQLCGKGGDGGGFCLSVGEDVEGVVECGEECGEAAWGS